MDQRVGHSHNENAFTIKYLNSLVGLQLMNEAVTTSASSVDLWPVSQLTGFSVRRQSDQHGLGDSAPSIALCRSMADRFASVLLQLSTARD